MSSMSCWSIVLPLSQCQQMFPSCSLQETLQGHEEAPESLVGQAPKVGHLPSCVEAGICHISPSIGVSNYRELKITVISHQYIVVACPLAIFLLSFQRYLLYCHGSLDQEGY